MTDRFHLTINVDLFIDDEEAMREAAFSRLREAWSSSDDFPYDSAADIPFEQVMHSLIADTIPAELPGCRRSQLDVESKAVGSDVGTDAKSGDSASEDHQPGSEQAADEPQPDKAAAADGGPSSDASGEDSSTGATSSDDATSDESSGNDSARSDDSTNAESSSGDAERG